MIQCGDDEFSVCVPMSAKPTARKVRMLQTSRGGLSGRKVPLAPVSRALEGGLRFHRDLSKGARGGLCKWKRGHGNLSIGRQRRIMWRRGFIETCP